MILRRTAMALLLVLATLLGSLSTATAAVLFDHDPAGAIHQVAHDATEAGDDCCEPARSHSGQCHMDVWADFGCVVTAFASGTMVATYPESAAGRASVVAGILDPPRL